MANRFHKARFKTIVRNYGLQLHNVKSYASLYKPNAAFRVSTDEGDFLIKPFYRRKIGNKLTTKQQIVRLSSYIQKLKEHGYPHLPNWLVTKSGGYWVTQSGRPYYMMEWVEGGQLQSEQDYENLGSALATLHNICKGSLPPMSRCTRNQTKLFKMQDILFRRRLPTIRKRKGAGKWFNEHGGHCIKLANEAWGAIDAPEPKHIMEEEINHPALIHGDVTSPNVIIHSNGLFLIDWDQLRIDSTYYEIVKTLLNTTNYNQVQIDALLRGYEQLKPLIPAERVLVSSLFRLPVEAWIAARGIASGRGSRVFRLLERTWDARLSAIQWMDEWARRQLSDIAFVPH
ncbi:aminoglycoside phosphotransferase family protein [Paenibacillus profundus]|uniref:Aminoglycoside phosphotransferase family protein n=1 Tax=Paenibacillus profundus TaxID=1173085 RepID=A0ABS8YKV5_9BACL|nr:phosphotransferase [Paenibacillus profundus]MCE5171205.1 aminoglycoside phosphotransferase family protein [Paenibacillus profundus]